MSKFNHLILLACTLAVAGFVSTAGGAERKAKYRMLSGPATAHLGNIAQVELPSGYVFYDGKATREMLKAAGEPVSDDELGLIQSTNEDWSVIFEFSDVGYIKDADKEKLDADKLLADITRGNNEANKERKRNGSAPLEIVGWEVPPKYNPETHNLEWAIRGKSEGDLILNYNTRLLGRKGVMEVVLIVDPAKLEQALPQFRELMANYSFSTGNTYAEYRSGDKVAKYGLAALVLGGAAVGAAKLGLFTWLILFLKKGWKLVIVAFAAVASFFKKLWSKITGRSGQAELEE